MTTPSMRLKLPAIRQYVQSMPWAIEPTKGAALLEVLGVHALGHRFTREEITARIGGEPAPRAGPQSVQGKQGAIQVINLFGVVAHRMDMLSEMSGGCSTLRIADEFDAAMSDPNVSAIVFNVDSPGGSTDGVPELAQRIRNARGKGKKLIAVSNTLMASAAYWLGSQCDEVIATPSSAVGSIGVFMVHLDESGLDEQMGLTYTLLFAGKHKIDGNPYQPLSDDARVALQSDVDAFYTLFVNDVAKGRKVRAAAVQAGYGEGRCLIAQHALEAGLIDRIDTLDGVLGALGAKNVTASGKPRPATGFGARVSVPTDPDNQEDDDMRKRSDDGGGDESEDVLDVSDADACPVCGSQLKGDECSKCGYKSEDADDASKPGDGTDDDGDDDDDGHGIGGGARGSADARQRASRNSRNGPRGRGDQTMAADNANAIAAERRRAAEIRSIGAELLSAGVTQATIDRAVNDGLTIMEAQAAFNGDIKVKHKAAPGIRVGETREAQKPFASFGEQLMAIIAAGRPGFGIDPRLKYINAKALETERRFFAGTPSGQDESVGSEGGFFIAPELLPGVIEPVFDGDPILSRVFRIPSASPMVKYNVVDETSRATGSRWGGIQMYRAAEADQATASKFKLRLMELTKKKMIGLGYLTDELLVDAPAANALLTKAFQAELRFMLTDEFFRGSGAGQMLGIFKSKAVYQASIVGGQTIANSNQYIATNAATMLASLPPSLWSEAIWLYQPELLPTMVTAVVGTGGSAVPVFLGANGISGRPYDTIFGRAAFASEFCEAVGTPGDLILIAPSEYHMLSDDGAIQATSLHVRFLFDEMALRITHRSDGAPVWRTTVTKYKGTQPWAPFITLGTRS